MKGQEVIKANYSRSGSKGKYKFDGFEIEGLDELMKAFSALGTDVVYKLAEPSTKGAELILARAKSRINNITGELENALIVRKPGKQQNKKAYQIFAKVGFRGRQGREGVPLELGHRLYFFGKKTNSDIEPKPYLRPAADESKTEVANIMANAMNKILEEWGD